MKATETALRELLDSTKQYVVPLYQRPYSWERKDWATLWEDLVYLYENPEPPTHFMGSIVTAPAETNPASVPRYLLIDGQQRMTTVSILLCALRDVAYEKGDEMLAAQVNETYVVNKFHEGDDRFKLIPTQSDRGVFAAIVEDGTSVGKIPDTEVDDCYHYFRRALLTDMPEEGDYRRMMKVIVNRLSLVSIALSDDDNPHLVFESLNGKGRPLTQADLIRNYFFMRIAPEKQEKAYRLHWKKMEDRLPDLTEFVRHYLISETGSWIKTSDVYYVLKQRIDKGQVDAFDALVALARSAKIYLRFLDPDLESNPHLAEAYRWFHRANITTVYPFLLGLIADVELDRIGHDDVYAILQMIHTYILRRAVCGFSTSRLNKDFSTLYQQVHKDEEMLPVERVRYALGRGCPGDAQFRKHLVEGKLYGRSSRQRIVRIILEELEKSFPSKERPNLENLTIEHILPQTLSQSWADMLGDEADVVHELYLHTLGNLTLTGYNSELSNAPFDRKKEWLERSNLQLNRYFDGVNQWDGQTIVERGKSLATIAIDIWPYFGDESGLRAVSDETVTGSSPTKLTINLDGNVVRSWREVLTHTLEWLVARDYEFAQSLMTDYPRFIGLDSSDFRNPFLLTNGWYCETNLSARRVYTFCRQAVEHAGIQADQWKVEVLENVDG